MSKRKAPFHWFSVLRYLCVFLVLYVMLPLVSCAEVCPFDSLSNASLLRDGDSTHLLTEGACFVLTDDQTLTPCAGRCAEQPPVIFFACTTPDHTTYGFGRSEIYQWCPDAFTCWKRVGAISGGVFLANPTYAVSEGICYTVGNACNEYGQVEDSNWTVIAQDIASGRERVLCVLPAGASDTAGVPMAVQTDGSLVLALREGTRSLRLTRVDPVTGQTSTLTTLTLDSQVLGLACREGGGWYGLTGDGLYLLREDGSVQLVNPVSYLPDGTVIPLEVYPDCVRFIAGTGQVSAEGYAVRGLYTVSLTPSDVVTLRVAAAGIDPNVKLAFEQQHPGVVIECLTDYQQFEKVSEALISGSPVIDLMLLRSFDGGLTRVLDKGYCCDLSDLPEVSAFVSRLYPLWQQEVVRQGRILALPLEVSGNFRTGYHAARWAELGLGEVPQTYEELLGRITEWLENDRLEGTPLLPGGSYVSLRFLLLEQYIARAGRQGETPVFQTDTFIGLMERLQAMKPLLDAYDSTHLEGSPLLNHRLFSGLRSAANVSEAAYQPLPMGFDSAGDRGETVRLFAAVVNPQSTQQALAKELLVMLLNHLEPTQYYALTDTVCPGVESPDYALLQEATSGYIAQLEAELEAARAAEDGTWMLLVSDDLDRARARYEANEATRYLITAEDAAYFRQLVPSMVIQRENGLSFLMTNAEDALRGFRDGKLSARDLARRLDQIMSAWVMENE